MTNPLQQAGHAGTDAEARRQQDYQGCHCSSDALASEPLTIPSESYIFITSINVTPDSILIRGLNMARIILESSVERVQMCVFPASWQAVLYFLPCIDLAII